MSLSCHTRINSTSSATVSSFNDSWKRMSRSVRLLVLDYLAHSDTSGVPAALALHSANHAGIEQLLSLRLCLACARHLYVALHGLASFEALGCALGEHQHTLGLPLMSFCFSDLPLQSLRKTVQLRLVFLAVVSSRAFPAAAASAPGQLLLSFEHTTDARHEACRERTARKLVHRVATSNASQVSWIAVLSAALLRGDARQAKTEDEAEQQTPGAPWRYR